MAAPKPGVSALCAVRRIVSLCLVVLLVAGAASQPLAAAETRTEEPPTAETGEGEDPGSVPEEPPLPEDPDPQEPDPTDVVIEPELPQPEPTQIPTDPPHEPEPELPTAEPTLPLEEPTLPDLPPTETPTIPDAEPSAEPTATEPPTAEPTARPANVDALIETDVTFGVVLEPGQSWQFDYLYSVSTSRLATTLTAGIDGATEGWSITLYAGSGQSEPGLQVAASDQSALVPGSSFGVNVVITAPATVTAGQTVAYWIAASATPDDGAPDEAGATTSGPELSVIASTPTPTATPTETPTPEPTATPDPPIPFAPTLTCVAQSNASTESPSAGWHLETCTATWETANVSTLQVHATTGAADWLAAARPVDAAVSSPEGGPVMVPIDANTASAQFLLVTETGCGAARTAPVSVELTATSIPPVPVAEGDEGTTTNEVSPTVETSLHTVNVTTSAATAPDISVGEATFSPVDVSDAREPSTGTIRIDYANADTACPWELTVTLEDLAGGGHVIPVATMEVLAVTGTVNPAYTATDGEIVITTSGDATGSGSITIQLSLEIPASIPPGDYATTVTAGARLLP